MYIFMKLFKKTNINIIAEYQEMFGFTVRSVAYR